MENLLCLNRLDPCHHREFHRVTGEREVRKLASQEIQLHRLPNEPLEHIFWQSDSFFVATALQLLERNFTLQLEDFCNPSDLVSCNLELMPRTLKLVNCNAEKLQQDEHISFLECFSDLVNPIP